MIRARCLHCDFLMECEEGAYVCCPNCKTTALPLDESKYVQVFINWNELRTLIVWAEQWAIRHVEKTPETEAGRGVVYSIASRIRRQYPNMGVLTLAETISTFKTQSAAVYKDLPGIDH